MISNREAMEQGKLGGGDVLELAGAKKAPGDTGEELGWNPAPGLVSALLGARGDEAREVVGIDRAIPGSDRSVVAVSYCGRYVTREDLSRPGVAWSAEERAVIESMLDAANVAIDAEIAKRYGDSDRLDAAEKIAKPLRVMKVGASTLGGELMDLASALHALAEVGAVVLPAGIDFEVVNPTWPNPSQVEGGQVWECLGEGSGFMAASVVKAVGDYTEAYMGDAPRYHARFRDGWRVGAAQMPTNPLWRCIGYELPDRSRILIGEYRASKIDRYQPWRVTAILDGARVLLTKPGYTMEQSVADVAARDVVGPFSVGLRSVLATQFMFRRFAHYDSNGEVPLIPTSPTMYAEAASSDVIQGEQDRSASPPSADCGPSPIIDAHDTPGRRAMAEQGWKIIDE